MRYFLLFIIYLFTCQNTLAQQKSWQLHGTIYDVTKRYPMEYVTVMTTSGRGTMSDSLGKYSITVDQGDSVYFSFQNKQTGKYPVAKMEDQTQFNMSLHIQLYAYLPDVEVRAQNYRRDSIANRRMYDKYFGYSKPNPFSSINIGPTGVGMDPNEIINMFRFRRNRQLASLQRRLIQEEQDKFIDHRFTKALVKKLTNMKDNEELDAFMKKYRPPVDFLEMANDLELGYYIQQCYRTQMGLLPSGVLLYKMGADSVYIR